MPSKAEAVGASDVATVGVGGHLYAESNEIEEPEVDNVVSVEAALLKTEPIICVIWVLGLIDALIILVGTPEAASRVRPDREARPPGVGCRLPAGSAGRVSVLTGDVRRGDKAGDFRRD